jgi:hypothetical protein
VRRVRAGRPHVGLNAPQQVYRPDADQREPRPGRPVGAHFSCAVHVLIRPPSLPAPTWPSTGKSLTASRRRCSPTCAAAPSCQRRRQTLTAPARTRSLPSASHSRCMCMPHSASRIAPWQTCGGWGGQFQLQCPNGLLASEERTRAASRTRFCGATPSVALLHCISIPHFNALPA